MSPSPTHDSTTPLLSDLEEHDLSLTIREKDAEDVLKVIGKALDETTVVLDDLERSNLLGSAIVRCCNDLADGVRDVGVFLKSQSDDERREFIRTVIASANNQVVLQDGSNNWSENDILREENRRKIVAEMSEEEMACAVSGAETLLFDVEEVLRTIGRDEANEIAEVGLVVAKMFVCVLQSFHRQVTPSQLAGTEDERNWDSETIIVLDGDNPDAIRDEESFCSSTPKRVSTSDENDDPLQQRRRQQQQHLPRMRLLWPPLVPTAANAGKWTCETAAQHPILSTALALTLWPAALATALFVAPPLLATDYLFQKGYDAIATTEHPVLATMEHTAWNVCQVAKLYLLCGKIVLKQSWRVGERQIERRGGVACVAQDVGNVLIDRMMHPVETAGMVVGGIGAGWNGLIGLASSITDAPDTAEGCA
mmetsp:Transcript_22598/g.27877  ORF Transcript_22598/g.27877 Transcript_22598/m.27877 type:complete len:424 (+) Transcript_22598:102-1373(+)